MNTTPRLPFARLLLTSASILLLCQCQKKETAKPAGDAQVPSEIKEQAKNASPEGATRFSSEIEKLAKSFSLPKDGKEKHKLLSDIHRKFSKDYPVFYDWWLQDGGTELHWMTSPFDQELKKRITKVSADLGKPELDKQELSVGAYLKLCEERRKNRLSPFTKDSPAVVFTKFSPLRPSFFAYTEGLSDARAECNFIPGGELALLKMEGIWGTSTTLFKDKNGVIRDPNVHFDGERVLFSWKKSRKEDDFHLYETNLRTKELRQLTDGKGCADFEGIYLPDDNILFNSSRSGQSVDCWYTEVSNLYLCDKDGKYIRQVGFDQVHTAAPALLDDGRVVYTRWDYNDRAQVYVQPLFQMFPDGTAQSAYYGFNSWFPTTLVHSRQIPGTRKIMATLTGHHAPQHGKLGIIDPEAGREENEGVTLVAPIRETKAERIDSYGQFGDQFQYPYPLNETDFLISYSPLGYHTDAPMKFALYWMNVNGERELLTADPDLSCNQPQPAMPRKRPFRRVSSVDYSQNMGTYYLQNIYAGDSLPGIEPGSIKKLRIVELEFRAASIGHVQSRNEGVGDEVAVGSQLATPIGTGNSTWDVKKIHGTVDVAPDGSAFFTAPARKPLYFQALDENGYVVQTMRSWSTLQPGEFQSCVGCHEHKNTVPLANHPVSQAMAQEIQSITPPEGGIKGFSFVKEIQPILDKHCISCHDGVKQKMSLKSDLAEKDAVSFRRFSQAYVNLTHSQISKKTYGTWQAKPDHPEVNWISSMSAPTLLPPYSAGAAKSKLMERLKTGHGKTSPAEISKFATWIDLLVPFVGDYTEENRWDERQKKYYDYYVKKRERFAEEEKEALRLLIEANNSNSNNLPQ